MLGVNESVENINKIEVYETGVVLAISRHDEARSTIHAAKYNCDHESIHLNWDDRQGPIFQLHNRSGFIWDNDLVTQENLGFGCLLTYKNDCRPIYIRRIECKPLVSLSLSLKA